MKFKDILVHIDNSPQCAGRLELAVALAKEHDAQLTGLYVIVHQPYATQNVSAQEDEERAQGAFSRQTGEAGIRAEWISADWKTVGVTMAEVINYHAHAKDLIVVGQTDPREQQWDVPADLPQQVVVGAGRPVLVVPYAGSFKTVGKRPIVAWKTGRPAARAVNDALPILLNAEEVFVLSINDVGCEADAEHGGSICANLERHAIKVKQDHIMIKTIPVASLLMNYAWEHSCDLIIMGVYAKKTRGKDDLGPVAKDFFNFMTLPVLMSN